MSETALPPLEVGEDAYLSYDNLINSFGVEVLLDVSDDDYQGSTRLVLGDGDRRGLLTFGWGSCSGCDALQAAYGSAPELNELRDELWTSVQWFESGRELAGYIASKDWDLDWGSAAEFARKALILLLPKLLGEATS